MDDRKRPNGWDEFPDDLPKHDPSHDRPADGRAAPWLDDFIGQRVSTSHVDGMDEETTKLRATVIKEKNKDGAWIACTTDAVTYLTAIGDGAQ